PLSSQSRSRLSDASVLRYPGASTSVWKVGVHRSLRQLPCLSPIHSRPRRPGETMPVMAAGWPLRRRQLGGPFTRGELRPPRRSIQSDLDFNIGRFLHPLPGPSPQLSLQITVPRGDKLISVGTLCVAWDAAGASLPEVRAVGGASRAEARIPCGVAAGGDEPEKTGEPALHGSSLEEVAASLN
ncbi:unnamed protein product, partial [Urochloa humidicola]